MMPTPWVSAIKLSKMGLRNLVPATFCAALVAAAQPFFGPAPSAPDAAFDSKPLDLAESQILQDPLPVWFAVENSTADDDADVFPMPLCGGFELEEATIDELQDALNSGALTSVEIVLCYLQRIQQTDAYLRAIMQLNPDFLQIAASLDLERAAGHVRGPLHGIPFLVKDNIATKDKMETTAGSYALLGSIVPRDAHVVHRLRQEGALLLGHATLSEWADMRSNSYSEGYSARGEQCRSAYNLTVNPGGSSSGSGVAVGANLVTFAIGTETDGSVVNPAQRNALVGIKPTVGLTSRAGVIPESSHQDTGARFGIPWLSFWQWADADMQAQLLELINLIKDSGATVINGTELPNWETIVSPSGWNWDYGTTRGRPNESEYTYIKVDFYNDLALYLSELENTPIRTLADLVRFNTANAGTEGGVPGAHPAFASGQDGLLAALATGGVRDTTYWQALSFCQRATRSDGIDAALGRHGVDALLAPADVAQAPQIAAQAGTINLPYFIVKNDQSN
ncbi:putative amidase family protein [Neofusicoccum parvum UCRNP2]|uniref:Putative amidase family protein n=1 Tax=Botryosphaeria parva (strain UCR-NP2) TaxID=1287680 RepID=R1GPS1_BOTPV|nr:putative amidase family protein [Neofusicoccum parvum UCRNP2]